MDITSKYRAKQPPKEHEEAVRMLLEGIASSKKELNQSDSREVSSNSYEFDGRSLNSSNTSASDAQINVLSKKTSYPARDHYSTMRSKATSTSDDSTSSSGIDHDVMSKEPIPSRTIAVQCDLKTSSLKHDNIIDGSMQASSISSTKYGFYSFTPEILENRRKLQRATSNKEITRSQLSSQIEAPTSMSDLSFGRSASDDEGNRNERPVERSTLTKRTFNGTLSNLDDGSTARARINSLPRRPVTAMSYVSTSRLRDQTSPIRSREKIQQTGSRNLSRAVSQQALVRPRLRANPEPTHSNSDSDSGSSQLVSVKINQNDDYDEVAQREENFATKRCLATPVKPPRPTLVSSIHNEQVRDYRTLRTVNPEQENQTSERDLNANLAYKIPDGLSSTYRSRKSNLVDQQPVRRFNKEDENHSILNNETIYSLYDSCRYKNESLINHSHSFIDNETSKLNSMSLSRKPRQLKSRLTDNDESGPTSGYCTTNRRPYKLSNNERIHSQTLSNRPQITSPDVRRRMSSTLLRNGTPRSDSVRRLNRSDITYEPKPQILIDQQQNYQKRQDLNLINSNLASRTNLYKQREFEDEVLLDSDNSESPQTKTWTNPNANPSFKTEIQNHGRKSSRSYSLRNINKIDYDDELDEQDNLEPNEGEYYRNSDQTDFSSYKYNSDFQTADTTQKHFSRIHSTDYDSQHRLDEIGLPEINLVESDRHNNTSASYLGLSNHRNIRQQNPDRITGRAMSQQSLTRPTMPLSTARRRGASNSGSEVGGSSMSLMSRLNGRYENAHTRTPVVMYIPQVSSSSKSSHLGEVNHAKVSTLRKSIRSRHKSSSQDRSRRSLSRNGSDSESSSMLRTLVKPRIGRLQASKRYSRANNIASNNDEDYEDTDGVAQLASELDTYKFRRRYSVPKDAKINWFSKLRQRVSSGAK